MKAASFAIAFAAMLISGKSVAKAETGVYEIDYTEGKTVRFSYEDLKDGSISEKGIDGVFSIYPALLNESLVQKVDNDTASIIYNKDPYQALEMKADNTSKAIILKALAGTKGVYEYEVSADTLNYCNDKDFDEQKAFERLKSSIKITPKKNAEGKEYYIFRIVFTKNGDTTSGSVRISADNSATKVGTTFTKGNYRYVITSKGEVAITGAKKKNITKLTVPATVKYSNTTFYVTRIKSGAFKGFKKLETVTIGKNVRSIDTKAFYNCGKLESVKITSKNIVSIGKNAFAKTSKGINIKLPKKYVKKYQKLLKSSGVKKAKYN